MPRPAAGERLNAARRRSCRRGRGGGGARARLAHPRDSIILVLSTDYRLEQGVPSPCASPACPLRALLPKPARLLVRPQTHARAAQARRRGRRRWPPSPRRSGFLRRRLAAPGCSRHVSLLAFGAAGCSRPASWPPSRPSLLLRAAGCSVGSPLSLA